MMKLIETIETNVVLKCQMGGLTLERRLLLDYKQVSLTI